MPPCEFVETVDVLGHVALDVVHVVPMRVRFKLERKGQEEALGDGDGVVPAVPLAAHARPAQVGEVRDPDLFGAVTSNWRATTLGAMGCLCFDWVVTTYRRRARARRYRGCRTAVPRGRERACSSRLSTETLELTVHDRSSLPDSAPRCRDELLRNLTVVRAALTVLRPHRSQAPSLHRIDQAPGRPAGSASEPASNSFIPATREA
jgi:hypothetical protein